MNLSKDHVKQIFKNYEQTRNANKRTASNRKNEIYKHIPKIKAIDNEIITSSMEITDSLVKSPEEKDTLINTLKERLKELRAYKLELLAQNGYSKNYLDPIYSCDLCKDTGYIDNKKCTCFKQATIELSYEQSNLKEVLQRENFSTFSFDYYSKEKDPVIGISPYESIVSIYKCCKNFIKEFDNSFSNLILYGQAGLGKTFLCNCIAKELLDNYHTVIYLSAYQLMRLFETYRFNNKENVVSYNDIEEIYTCDLLIIDDLGSEVINSFSSSELFNALNIRLLKQKSTVISTNLGPSEWSNHYSTRIVSRIFGNYTPIQLIGNDIRLIKYQ